MVEQTHGSEQACHCHRRSTPRNESDDPYKGKNPHAVELGCRGGKKGGKARAEKLTAEERSEIARKAVRARWGPSDDS